MKKSFKKKSKNFFEPLYRLYFLLSLNRPSRDFKIIQIDGNDELIEKVFRFRFNIYCITDKLLDQSLYPNGLEKDEFDDRSFQFAVLDRSENVVGTFRLIRGNADHLFPTEAEFKLENLFSEKTRLATVEISRFMLDKKFRKTVVLLEMLKTIFQFSRQHQVIQWHGCAEQWFIDTLNSIIGPLPIIHKPQYCFNAINYPFIFILDEVEKNVRKRHYLLWKYFVNRSKNIQFAK